MKKFIHMIRRGLFAVALALVSGSALAADGDSFDFTPVTTQMTSLKTALSSWSTAFLPVLMGIVGVFIVYWLIKFAIRLAQSMSRSSAR